MTTRTCDGSTVDRFGAHMETWDLHRAPSLVQTDLNDPAYLTDALKKDMTLVVRTMGSAEADYVNE
jgi:hypothetical protein